MTEEKKSHQVRLARGTGDPAPSTEKLVEIENILSEESHGMSRVEKMKEELEAFKEERESSVKE